MEATLQFRQRFISPKTMLWGLLLLLALLEFYQINYGLSSVLTFAIIGVAAGFLLIFPRTVVIARAEFEVLIFLMLWLSYALVSYIWAQDRLMAADYALLIFRYLCIFMIFSAALRDTWLLGKVHFFLVGILVLYLITAVWEMLTWNHLPTSRMYGRNHFAPTGPFYGENILAAFMLLLLPFLMFLPKLYHKRWVKFLCGGLVLLFLLVIVIQGARIAMLAAAAAVLWVFLFFSSGKTKTAGIVIVLLAGFAIYQISPSGVKFAHFMLSRELRSFGAERQTVTMSSLKIRQQLFIETFDLAASTALMGVGGGNFEHYMNTDREYRTAGIINAHNWLLEILGNFGVIIMLGFLYIYIKWLYMLFRLYMKSRGRERYLYLMYLSSLVLFAAASALPSSIRWNHLIWIYFAAINSVCHTKQPLLKDYHA